MKALKEWFDVNRSWLITIVVIAVLDEMFLKGRFREKISSLIGGLLDRLDTKETKEKKE